ncbi:hypothetical protein LXL04_015764 [Taraxacum kok-saghyz]
MRLSDNETRLVADLTRLNVKPHDIVTTLKEQNPENVSTLKTIYNARDKIKMNEKAADGNCGFRAIAACLGLHEDNWSRIRADLLEELDMHQTEYDDMFGSQL